MGLDMNALRFICTREFWRMCVCWCFVLVFSYFQLSVRRICGKSRTFPRLRPNSATKPVCIITGASSGLGAQTASVLCKEGFHVILAGRSIDLLSKTIKEIKRHQYKDDVHLKAIELDVSSIQSILKFKTLVEQWLLDSNHHPSIQLLINNAGILATSSRSTADGYDQMMETNYFGAFALTNVLIPLLRKSHVPSRIVNVTSFTHRCSHNKEVNGEDIIGKKHLSRLKEYPFAQLYQNSKLYLLLFSYQLHRQLFLKDPSHHISVIAADPGSVKTNILREVPSNISRLTFTALKFVGLLGYLEDGVQSIIDAALAPPEASGQYFFGGKGQTLNSSSLSYDVNLAERLWSSSFKLLEALVQIKVAGEMGERS